MSVSILDTLALGLRPRFFNADTDANADAGADARCDGLLFTASVSD